MQAESSAETQPYLATGQCSWRAVSHIPRANRLPGAINEYNNLVDRLLSRFDFSPIELTGVKSSHFLKQNAPMQRDY
jgi:hypothetical protein